MELVKEESRGRFKSRIFYEPESRIFRVEFWFDGRRCDHPNYETLELGYAEMVAYDYCYEEDLSLDPPGSPKRKELLKKSAPPSLFPLAAW